MLEEKKGSVSAIMGVVKIGNWIVCKEKEKKIRIKVETDKQFKFMEHKKAYKIFHSFRSVIA